MIRCLLNKTTADGETLTFEGASEDVSSIDILVKELTKIADGRMKEMNIRLINRKKLMNHLEENEKNKFELILSYLYGEVSYDIVENRLNIYEEDVKIKDGEIEAC